MTGIPALGRWLKQRRRLMDLTQRDLARLVGCSVRSIQKYETGERRPSRRITELLAVHLDVPVGERAEFMRLAREQASSNTYPAETPSDLQAIPTWGVSSAIEHPLTSNLPVPSSGFIGRDQQIGEVITLLTGHGAQLVTLTGPPGIGKSRLALQVAATIESEVPHSIFIVSLANVDNPVEVPHAIEQALGLKEVSNRTEQEALVEHLKRNWIILLLDNFEHVISAGTFLAELLEACPNLRVLVTSREVLHISQEREYPVPPLSFPPPQERASAESLQRYEATRLFIQRAKAANVSRSFSLNDANAEEVAEICRKLEGVPLAIELAAARVKLLPPRTILDRLDRTLELLSGGPRDRPQRHRTLRAAIEWSYDLLPEAESRLLERLSVFAGGCNLDAAEAICDANNDLSSSVLDALSALVDKSLLARADARAGIGPRFDLLDMIREYADEKLEQRGEKEAYQRLHAWYFLNAVESMEEKLRGPEQAKWLSHIEADRDNIRAVLHWASNRRDNQEERVQIGLRLASVLRWYWMSQGYLAEGRKWLEEFLSRPEARVVPHVYVRALMTGGTLALLSANPASARPLFTQSIETWQTLDNPIELSRAVMGLGTVAQMQGEFDEAVQLYAYGVELTSKIGDEGLIAMALVGLGDALTSQGEYAKAKEVLEKSIPLVRSAANPWVMAQTYLHLGTIALFENDLKPARGYLRQSFDIWRTLGAIDRMYLCFHVLSRLSFRQGDMRTTARFFGAIESLRAVTGIRFDPVFRFSEQEVRETALSTIELLEWEQAWMDGRSLGVEEAIEFAADWLADAT